MENLSLYFNKANCDESVDLNMLALVMDNIRKSSTLKPTAEGVFACAEKRKAGTKFDMKTLVISLLESIGQLCRIPNKSLVALHEAGHAVVMFVLNPNNLLFTSVYGYTANIDESGIDGAIAGFGGIVATKTNFGGSNDEMQIQQILSNMPAGERPTYDECRQKAEEICERNRDFIEVVAKELEQREVLTALEIKELMHNDVGCNPTDQIKGEN